MLTLVTLLPAAVALAVAPGGALPPVIVGVQLVISLILVAVATHPPATKPPA